VLPADGRSLPVLILLAACYLATAAVFAATTRGLSMDRGTESLQAQPA
jgi:hypothetical protein